MRQLALPAWSKLFRLVPGLARARNPNVKAQVRRYTEGVAVHANFAELMACRAVAARTNAPARLRSSGATPGATFSKLAALRLRRMQAR